MQAHRQHSHSEGHHMHTTDLRRHCERRLGALDRERASWFAHWRDLADNILPRRGSFLGPAHHAGRGDKRNARLLDSTAMLAARTLASGLMGGLSSPARPWFRLGIGSPQLSELPEVRLWLDDVTQRMLRVFARSNLYNALAVVYEELGVFGTAAMVVVEDGNDVVRAYPLTAGEYWLAASERLNVNTLYRALSMTTFQLFERLGRDHLRVRCTGREPRLQAGLPDRPAARPDERRHRTPPAGGARRLLCRPVPDGDPARRCALSHRDRRAPRREAGDAGAGAGTAARRSARAADRPGVPDHGAGGRDPAAAVTDARWVEVAAGVCEPDGGTFHRVVDRAKVGTEGRRRPRQPPILRAPRDTCDISPARGGHDGHQSIRCIPVGNKDSGRVGGSSRAGDVSGRNGSGRIGGATAGAAGCSAAAASAGPCAACPNAGRRIAVHGFGTASEGQVIDAHGNRRCAAVR
ncbi:MAG: hypothetical protein K9G48_06220 [Reyranella sp.]|nr:hypothetical protein [Reyranella sp.]